MSQRKLDQFIENRKRHRIDRWKVAKLANQGNVKAKFNYISALSQGNLAVQKRTSMNPNTANQEIMLFAGTSFSRREFSPLSDNKRPELNTQTEELERACWAGMLFEMLPELSSPFEGSKTFIWSIYSANKFLLINQGTQPSTIENYFSIDPYCFLDGMKLN